MREASKGRREVERWTFAILCTTVIAIALPTLAPTSARAESELTLAWSAADGCPDRDWARGRIEEQLGRAVNGEVREGTEANIAIAKSETSYVVTLRSRRGRDEGERTLEGATCDEVAEAALLVLALSLSEAQEQRAQEVAPSEAPVPAQPQLTQRAHAPLEYSVRLDGVVERGLSSHALFGPQLALGLQRGWLRGELSGLWLVPRRVNAGDSSLEVSLWTVRAAGCLLWRVWQLELGPCLGLEIGQTRGAGVRTASTSSEHDVSLWSAAAIGPRLALRVLDALDLVLATELTFGLRRPRFVTSDGTDTDVVHQANLVQGRGQAGVQVRF